MDNLLKDKMNELRQVRDVATKENKTTKPLIGKIRDIVYENPNDNDLGRAIRNFFLELSK